MSTTPRYAPPSGQVQPAAHFAALVEGSEDAILTKDTVGVITSWNPAAERLYGYSSDEALGQSITLIIPEERRGEERQILSAVLAGKRLEHYETERVRKDGRRVQVSLTVSPIRADDGEVIGASVVARDIGELVAVRSRAATLHEITAALTREAEPERVIAVLLVEGVKALNADAATAGLLDEGGEDVVLAGAVGHSDEGLADWERFPLEAELPMSVAIRNSEPVWSSTEAELIERFPALAGADVRFAALAVVPLEVEGRPLGAVAFSFLRPRRFTDEERAFMRAIVQQASRTLERASLFEAERMGRRQLSFLARASEILSESLDIEQTLQRLAQVAVPEVADLCTIDLVRPGGGLRRVVTAHTDPNKLKLAQELHEGSSSEDAGPQALTKAIDTGEAEFYPRVTEELVEQWASTPVHLELIRQLDLSSAMILPLVARGRCLGAITLFSSESGRTYDDDDLELAKDLARRAALAVDTSVLYQREHETALTLQRALLPIELPEVEGVELAARYLPAEAGMEVGGDWYDVVEPKEGCLALVIGDVAGRGIEAAAVMGRLSMALRAYMFGGQDPDEAIAGLDQLMKAFATPQMATIFHLRVDLDTRVAEYVRAGHPPALLRLPEGEVLELEGQGGPPVGMVEGAKFPSAELELPRGSTLLLYTDGLIERRGVDIGESLARLKQMLSAGSGDPEAIVQDIPAALDAERVPDDIALLAMRLHGRS